ncbi:MAG: fused MFS/spermidine synthase [Coriobacteriia bacterium]|nr:fused MFS/spermidine synthase [Coriobacteriia bacterium]
MALNPKKIAGTLAAAGVVAASALVVGATAAIRSRHNPKVRTITDGQGSPVRVLEVDKTYQSATYVEEEKRSDLVLEYYRTFNVMFDFGLPIESVLMLGAGGCAYPLNVAKLHPEITVDAVECNEQIAQLARSHFFVDEAPESGNFKLHVCDGLEYLVNAKEEGTTYSVIINDCFNGKKPDDTLLTSAALKLSRKCLVKGGLYMVNVTSTRKGKNTRTLKKTTRALNRAFKHVYTFPCTDAEFGKEDNFVIVATNGNYKIEIPVVEEPEDDFSLEVEA